MNIGRIDHPSIAGAVLRCLSIVLALTTTAGATPGGVLSHQKISDTEGGFTGTLDDSDQFGRSVASLGDLDGNGVGDLAVGVPFDDDGGTSRGAVWVLFLGTDGTVSSHQKISDTQGGFNGELSSAWFGASVASLGDLDGDGVGDLAVGAARDDDGGINRGAVWILFLNTDGTVKAHQKISDTQGGFTGILDNSDWFATSVASLGDLDGDGVTDLAVGAPRDDDGMDPDAGAVWILFLNTDGTVKSHQKVSDTEGGFTGELGHSDSFGEAVASLGDLDGDGVGDLAVGARGDDDGGTIRGAVWVLFLNTDGTVKAHQKISDTEGGFTGILDNSDRFGASVASLGDLDGDGVRDLAVGAARDDDGGHDRGAVWILFLNTNGTVKAHQKISDTEGGFTGTLDNADWFATSVASLGDLDGDGVTDLAVGAVGDDDGGFNSRRGAVWVLFLDGCLLYDMNADGFISIIGDVPDFVDCVFFGNCTCPAPGCTCPGDCNCDGFLSIIGDVPCFVDCVFFGTCADCPDRSESPGNGDGFTIGGAVYEDESEPLWTGLEGITVNILDDERHTVASTTTAGPMGLWRIDNLPEGKYTAVFVESGNGAPSWRESVRIVVSAERKAANQSIRLLRAPEVSKRPAR